MEILNSEEYNPQMYKKDIMQTDLVLSKIFEYLNLQDLKAFNIVCKKWNQLSNLFVYRHVNLLRNIKTEEFINTNTKYAHYIKELTYCEFLKPQREMEFFGALKFLTKLNIYKVNTTQDQFMFMIKPLDKLEELKLGSITISEVKTKSLYNKPIQLPQTLIKLSINNLELVGNPALFIQTMNSHSRLKEFSSIFCGASELFTPFITHYPSLKSLLYQHYRQENRQLLVNIFKSNPQLLKLNLDLGYNDYSLANDMSQYLTNLEELYLEIKDTYRYRNENNFNIFPMPKNIKKLNLRCNRLSSDLLISIFKGCPELDEFILYIGNNFADTQYLLLNTLITSKIKKLKIKNNAFDAKSLDSILMNCPFLTELDILLSGRSKNYFKVINQRCSYLEKLSLQPLPNSPIEEYSSLEFLSRNFSFKNTLTNLILHNIENTLNNPKKIKYYPNLNSIKFLNQPRFAFNRRFNKITNSVTIVKSNVESDHFINSYPDYKIRTYNYSAVTYDAEIYKI
jgi:hypothetical protein